MKKYIFFIIIIMCVMFLSSCSQREIQNISTDEGVEDGTGLLADNSSVDFYFEYPENFTVRRNDKMIIIDIFDDAILQTDTQNTVMTRPNLSATVFTLQSDTYETVEQYWTDYVLPGYEGMYQKIEVLSEDDLTVDETPAKKYTYTCTLSGMNYKISQVIFFRNQNVYTLTYTAIGDGNVYVNENGETKEIESSYKTYSYVLNTAAETFKFK